MPNPNGKSETEMPELDLEHELPAGANEDTFAPDELTKLKAERDSLLDQLSAEDRADVIHDTAARFYGLGKVRTYTSS